VDNISVIKNNNMNLNSKEKEILDKVFQYYLDYNDNDEETRDLYLNKIKK